jgi:hypothetical protein
LRADSVPATVIDISTGLVEDWPRRAIIRDARKSDLSTSCFMLSSCLESLALTFASIKIAVTMWAKHIEVAKGQEGVANYALCTRRQGRRNELLIRGTRGSRFGTEVGLGIVIIGLKVSGHVVGCAHVLCRS